MYSISCYKEPLNFENTCLDSHKRLQLEYNNNRPIRDANSKNKLGDLKVTYKYDSHCADRMISKMNVFDNEEVIFFQPLNRLFN
jgi:hypothetical protein